MTTIAAVDPGLEGALAILSGEGVPIEVYDLPVIGTTTQRRVDAANLAGLIRTHGPATIIVEAVAAMPKQEVSSTFRFGQAVGTVAGVVGALGIPIVWVAASKWKKAAGLTPDKERSRQLAVEAFPALAGHLARKRDHNRAEALLLARYWIRSAAETGKPSPPTEV